MSDISIRKKGPVGHITLTRPKSLNALSHDMVLKIETALKSWLEDDTVKCVMIDAESETAFCAGGDIVDLYNQGMKQDYFSGQKYWRDEYRLNAFMSRYPKPIIAFMNGIVMGGGVGISAHCSNRVVTEKTKIALPECAIGLVPDVGTTSLLTHAPGYLGEYLGLTGYHMNSADAIYCGFADKFAPNDTLAEIKRTLCESGNLDDIEGLFKKPSKSELSTIQAEISKVFSRGRIEDVMSDLKLSQSEWAIDAVEKIERGSPLSCQVTFELVRQARDTPGIEEALKREFCFVSRAMQYGDFLEGVRAAVIDKDRNPQWRHASINDVTIAQVHTMLRAPEGGVLKL
ncbi:enoyl-CoA hydratase/isomerase family protein [Ahrensia kielensis]|uniref:enoyl-CoA hydratase/isomerase family protein n=1 Tax=Ahrensia kielensis TaxID=76980 RepID=UPI00035CB959|nr:enoyl-CoA hydratase/isomerase family protein [Ahrensia kielensis]